MKTQWWRFAAIALLSTCASCSKKGESTNATTSADTERAQTEIAPAGKEVLDVSPGLQVDDLDTLVDVIVAEAAELPRAEFDPAALAAKLGQSPQAHFDWVRDRTWWAPYRGLLRGSKGVMLDRVGSNLDRAVLLGDILRHAGHTVRLAHAELPDKLARELLARVRPMPDQRSGNISQKTASTERLRAMEAILPGFEQSVQEQIAVSQRRVRDAEALVSSQADLLHAAVKGAVNPDSTGDEQALAAMRDHWWVERAEKGEWIAMDVLLPDARLGNALAVAARTSAWDGKAVSPSIPDSDWHSVVVRVVVERYESGATTESTVLETVLLPAEVLDRPITLMHLPTPWPEALPDPKSNPNALGDAAVKVKEWVPFLKIGDEFVAQSGFSESGDLIIGALNPQRDITALGGGGFMTGFDAALGASETASSSITAEWIVYEIRVPGESSERLRRPVFDLLGPANRAAKTANFDSSTNDRLVERYEALLSRTGILVQPCEFTAEYVAHRASAGIVDNRVDIKKLSQERDPAKARHLASTILGRIDTWGPLPDLAFLRAALNTTPRDWFIDRPNVMNHRVTRPVVNGDRAALRETIDVASNAIGVRPDANSRAFGVRLRQGVTDTVAEMVVLGSEFSGAQNTASIFAASGGEPNYGVLIGGRDAETIQTLGWPEDVSARLAANIDAGFVAVAVNEPVSVLGRERVGWWRVDPASGETIGVMDTGFHEETADYSLTLLQLSFLRGFLVANAGAIGAARTLQVLTPGQSLLLRAAQAAEAAIALANRPFF